MYIGDMVLQISETATSFVRHMTMQNLRTWKTDFKQVSEL